ncbi:MAG: hypothetical protein HY800_02340 [Ignavibacteriales bacterium]|nr:hypothetical protein [Ignavibacteriales bacterium]
MSCTTIKPKFEICQLRRRWGFNILDTVINLQSNDTTITFSSRWTKSVREYPFTLKKWKLGYSNDTAFNFLNLYDLLPKLTITQNREFRFNWYFAPRNDTFKSNCVEGVYGIGENQSIKLYYTGVAYSSPNDPPVAYQDGLFVFRITKSKRFAYSNTTLTLMNDLSNFYYTFVPDI